VTGNSRRQDLLLQIYQQKNREHYEPASDDHLNALDLRLPPASLHFIAASWL
jgi:hypothetical protein